MEHISTVFATRHDEAGAHQTEPHGMCACPDARHDDWECPTCHRPSFSAERIAALRA